MPVEIIEKKARDNQTEPKTYTLYYAKKLIIDDECKKIEAVLINEKALANLLVYLEIVGDARLFSPSPNHANFKSVLKKDTLSIEFVGDLNDALTFLQQYQAVSKFTADQVALHLSAYRNTASATVLSRTPSM
jgi:hypothetical protein